MNGMDWAIKALVNALGLDPETVKSQIAGMGQIIVQGKAQMDRIEQNQLAIMNHLGLVPASNGANHVASGLQSAVQPASGSVTANPGL